MDGRKSNTSNHKVAILWRGDAQARRDATPQNNRFYRIFEELEAAGIHAEPAVYAEEFESEVREQLLAANGVLVWVDPIHQGRTRVALDALLRDVAAHGPWVSAHPDVTMKMGVKEVLHRTRHLGWGTDTELYRSVDEFNSVFPARLQSTGPRVLKQNRGNGGQGVWKVELMSDKANADSMVRVLHAQRGSMPEDLKLQEFMVRCALYFASGGLTVDQPFQPRLPEGMIRCYMGGRQSRWIWSPAHQSADPAAAGRAGFACSTAGSAHHARSRCGAVPETQSQNGGGVDATDDAGARAQCRVSTHYLGCGFPLRATHRRGRRHLCPVRDQCEFVFCASGSGAGSNCTTHGVAAARGGFQGAGSIYERLAGYFTMTHPG